MLRCLPLLLCLLPLLATSQITITKDHMPQPGDTIRYSVAATVGNNSLDKTGANQQWDFTDLTPIAQSIDEYELSWKTPYLLNFGFTALGQKIVDTAGTSQFQLKNVYNFYQNSNSSFSQVGLGFQFGSFPLPQSGKHSDPDEIYVFPLKYGNKDTTTFSLKVPISFSGFPVGSFFREGTRISVVDGWGKISTPYGDDIECIRIKSEIFSLDSISVSMVQLNFGTETKQVEYKWLSRTERIPILSVQGNEVMGNFVPTQIRYRDDLRTIGPIKEVKANFSAENPQVNKGEVIRLTNESDGENLSYSWLITPTAPVIFVNGTSSTSEHPKVIINQTGNYSVRLIASGSGVSDTSNRLDYLQIGSTSIQEKINVSTILYPNPSSESITLSNLPVQSSCIVISDLTGSEVMKLNTDRNQRKDINISQLAPGTYILFIFDRQNQLLQSLPFNKF